MSVVQVLSEKLRRLATADDGFAMALTLVVWPVLVMMVSGVYVTGDVIRQRILFQNAADSAAYSAALVQADALSRIAVINKMMAWTYVQANKMEMDATVLNMLRNGIIYDASYTVSTDSDLAGAPFYNALKYLKAKKNITCLGSSHSTKHDGTALIAADDDTNITTGTYGYAIGVDSTLDPDVTNYKSASVRLNGSKTVELSDMKDTVGFNLGVTGKEDGTAADTNPYTDLETKMKNAYANIAAMNEALETIQDKIATYSENVASDVLTQNLNEFSGWTSYCSSGDTNTYLKEWEDVVSADSSLRDSNFLSLYGYSLDSESWWVQTDTSKLQRRYQKSGNALQLQYLWAWKTWTWDKSTSNCYNSGTNIDYGHGTTTIEATDVYQGAGSSSGCVSAEPMILQTSAYASSGANVVAVKYPLTNPLSKIFGDLTNLYFDAYTPDTPTDMWVVSAAQAGANVSSTGTTYQYKNLDLNASANTDWNALMIPLTKTQVNTAKNNENMKPSNFTTDLSDTTWLRH